MPDSGSETEVIKHGNSIPWPRIPKEVKEEADGLADYTADTGREGSITFCKKPDRSKIFVGNNYEGDYDATEALDCDYRFGKSSRIGSMHSHPSNADTIGIVPSEADLASSVEDSYRHGKQIDCITSPDTPLIHCSTFNRPAGKEDAQRYKKALRKNNLGFFEDRISKDFDISLFDRKTGEREDEPAPTKVIKAAFGKSNKELRKEVTIYERGTFCNMIADRMGQNTDNVINECRRELRRRSFLGLIEYET